MNNLIRTSALLLATLAPLAVPLRAGAQTAPIRPNQPPRGNVQQPQQPPPQEELNEAIEFMKKNAPHRLSAMQGLRAPRAVENAKWTIVNQKRRFDQIKSNNADSPEVYQARLKEYQINDDIFELCRQIIQQPKTVATIEPQLRGKVQELFDVGIQERKARIDRLEKQLARLKKEVQNDEAKRDDLVAKNYQTILKEGVPGAPLSGGNPGEERFAQPPPRGSNNK